MNETETVNIMAALAQETRLGLFRLLIKQGPDGLNAGTIAERLGVPRSTLSYHLAALEQVGLITARRETRQIIYAAHYGVVEGFLSFLVEDCCQGSGDICLSIQGQSLAC